MIEKQFKELLDFANTTDLQDVVWEKNGTLISFRRGVLPPPPSMRSAPPEVGSTGENGASAEPMVIRSTMVGTFFRSDSPDRPPFVVEGTLVNSGQPVAAIEAMKIMKDVLASVPCQIVKALVANGHPVEYGQPLFEVEAQHNENV